MFREVDRIRVKGKQQPVVMYELLVSDQELLPEFEKGLELYRGREFKKALAVFESLVKQFDDGPSKLYIQRCSDYLETPPPPDWDGVYTANGK
jgi:adenylate cyclase